MKTGRAYVMTERARSTEETGERILEATLALFVQVPYSQLTLRAVAEHAGVTVQTVIRRYGDKEGLVAAAAARFDAVIGQSREAAVGDVVGAVEHLVAGYEASGPHLLRLLAEEDTSPLLADIAAHGRTRHREWCTRVFAPFLTGLRGADRTRRMAQLVAVCDVYTWKLLRVDAGLSQRQVAVALLELLGPLTTLTTPLTPKGQ